VSKLDIETTRLASELLTKEHELAKAEYWMEKLKFMKSEATIRKTMLEHSIEHLKKRGVISSFSEFGKIKEGLRRVNLELMTVESDLADVALAIKRARIVLDQMKDQYQRVLVANSENGTVLNFRGRK